MAESPLSSYQLFQLRNYGYVSLDARQFSNLLDSFAALFEVSKEYFALDTTHDAKRRYRAPSGSGASEEGFSIVPTEKQIFTCRSYPRTPAILNQRAKEVWERTGSMLQGVMRMIADDLGLRENPYSPLLGQCVKFEQPRTPTLLRLFRYDRPQTELSLDPDEKNEEISRVVAERHKDLGLLSIVVGSSPGLEVFNETTSEWISIEEPSASQTCPSGLTITLLSGQVLRYLSRGRYSAGVHRVRCSSMRNADGTDEPFRYSIVYALRPYPSLLDLSNFESTVVGTFTKQERDGIDGQSAQILFNKLCGQHWNVNISQKIREEQRQATLAEKDITPGLFTVPQASSVVSHGASALPQNSSKNNTVSTNRMNQAGGRWGKLKRQLTRTFAPSSKSLAQANA